MKKIIVFGLIAFFAASFSKIVLAEVVPITIPTVAQDDVVVVFDDDFLKQQNK